MRVSRLSVRDFMREVEAIRELLNHRCARRNRSAHVAKGSLSKIAQNPSL